MFVGIDLGGTKIAVAVVDTASGAVVSRTQTPTESQIGWQHVLARMLNLVRDTCAAAGVPNAVVQGIGVGVPGVFDFATGQTLFLPNLAGGWRGVPVGATLAEAFDCPVWLINDVRAFVLAEATMGAGRGAPTVVGLTLGTGIGGGIAIAGKLHLGIGGSAGEIGHQTLDPDGPVCGCGNRGCLEALASGTAIAAYGAQALAAGRSTILAELANNLPEQVTPALIGQAAAAGDPVSTAILERAAYYLGIGVANAVTMLSPDRVVLGGSVANLGERLFAPVRATIQQRCRATPVEKVEVVPAALGADAGVLGAAIWAAQQ